MFSLFKRFNFYSLVQLEQRIEEIQLNKNVFVYKIGDLGDKLFFIKQGKVEVTT